MRKCLLFLVLCSLLSACGPRPETGAEGTSGAGEIYGRGSAQDDHQRAQEAATDPRPRGGSMEGAGGAGPGFDGSREGTGPQGTVPGPGAGFGAGLTNTPTATNGPATRRSVEPPQQR